MFLQSVWHKHCECYNFKSHSLSEAVKMQQKRDIDIIGVHFNLLEWPSFDVFHPLQLFHLSEIIHEALDYYHFNLETARTCTWTLSFAGYWPLLSKALYVPFSGKRKKLQWNLVPLVLVSRSWEHHKNHTNLCM